jgi:hypothetical protein
MPACSVSNFPRALRFAFNYKIIRIFFTGSTEHIPVHHGASAPAGHTVLTCREASLQNPANGEHTCALRTACMVICGLSQYRNSSITVSDKNRGWNENIMPYEKRRVRRTAAADKSYQSPAKLPVPSLYIKYDGVRK